MRAKAAVMFMALVGIGCAGGAGSPSKPADTGADAEGLGPTDALGGAGDDAPSADRAIDVPAPDAGLDRSATDGDRSAMDGAAEGGADRAAIDGAADGRSADAAADHPIDAGVDAPGPAPDAAATDGPWRRLSLADPKPPARVERLIHDFHRDRLVLISCVNEQVAGPLPLWEWDGATGTWIDRLPVPTPAAWPVGRCAPAVAYHHARRKVVLHGGARAGGFFYDTWEWDGATGTWAQRTPPKPWPPGTPSVPPGPSVRAGSGLGYDTVRGKLVLFGGQSFTTFFRDIWEWDGETGAWTDRTPSPLPAAWPPPRFVAGFAYHPSRRTFTLVGGSTGARPMMDVWDWDGATNTWLDRTPSPLPAAWPEARDGFGLAVDDARATLWLFGGNSHTRGVLADLWEWDGGLGRWVDRTQVPLPEAWPRARHWPGFTRDVNRRELVLVGGYVGPGGPVYNPDSPYIRDHWRLAP